MTEVKSELPPKRVRRAFQSWATSGVLTIATILVGIVARPILLNLLGDERLGANRVATDLLGHLVLLDLGFNSGIAVLVVHRAAAGNFAALATLVLRSRRWLVPLAGLSFCMSLPLAWSMPVLADVPRSLHTELRWASLLATLALWMAPLTVYRTVLESTQAGYVVNLALLLQSLTATALTIVFAYLGWGLIAFSAATLVAAGLYFATITWSGRRAVSRRVGAEIEDHDAPVSAATVWSYSWPMLLASLTNRISQFTDSLIVARMFSVSAAFQYDVTQVLIRLAGGQINVLASVSWPALAEIRVREGPATFEARLLEVVGLVAGLGTVLTGTVAAYNSHFVANWVGAQHYGGTLLSFAVYVLSVVFGVLLVFSVFLDNHGHARARLPAAAGGAALKLLASIGLAAWIGIPGVALGTALSYLSLEAWYYPLLVSRKYQVRLSRLARAALIGLLRGAPYAAGIWFWAVQVREPITTWHSLLGELLLAGAFALAYCWCAVLSPNERARWRRRIGFDRPS